MTAGLLLPRLLTPVARCSLPQGLAARGLHLAARPVASSAAAGRSTSPLLQGVARRAFNSGSGSGRSSSSARWSSTSTSLGVVALSALGWAHLRTGAGASGPIFCESAAVPPPPPPASSEPAASIINPYELGFGAVCGLCAGVFVKKGAKLLAFALGGVFVLLQYMNSLNLVKVNWSKIGARYTNATAQADGLGGTTVLTAKRAFNWVVDFLTRDFQQRATFVGGFVLGLRLG